MKKALYRICVSVVLCIAVLNSYGNVISLATNTATTYCLGAGISVTFSSTATFGPTNSFYLELSDATGGFTAPATLASNFSQGVSPLTGTFPSYISNITSPGHMIRIRSTSPAYISDTLAITINGPAVTVSNNSTNNNACFDSSVTFNAAIVNGGSAPTYKWIHNASIVPGATSSSYTTNALATGDILYCIVTGNGTCPGTAYSNLDTMTVYTTQNSYVNITLSHTNISCPGTSITCTASPVNGGASPTYQWIKNGVAIPGATGSTYTNTYYTTDTINCAMTSSRPCTVPYTIGRDTWGLPGTQPAVAMPINVGIDTIGITSPVICAGGIDTFTARYSNYNASLGAVATFQWQQNGINIPGATAIHYITPTPVTGDTITCLMTITGSANSCTYGYRSNNIIINLQTAVTPVINIASSTGDSICSGTSVTFTSQIVNGGSAPSYTWVKNSVNIPGATGSTYTTTTIANGDVISCVLTSSAGCISAPNTISQTLTFVVNTAAIPTLLITASPGTNITAGTSVTFAATTLNGGSAPTYQWTLNSVPISGANSSTYTTAALANNDIIGLTMTSNLPCVSPATVTANPLSIKVSSGVETIGSATIAASIFPEPNQGTFTIRGSINNDHKEDHVKVVVLNTIGQVVFTDTIPVIDNSVNRQETLPGNIASGVYLVQLSIDGRYKTLKLVISK